jgi:hypothetical protein
MGKVYHFGTVCRVTGYLSYVQFTPPSAPNASVKAAAIFADIWLKRFHDVIYSALYESGRLGNVV